MLNFHSLIDITMLGDCFFFLQTNLEQKIMNLEQRNLDLMTKDTGLETKVVDLMSKDVDLVSKFVSILQHYLNLIFWFSYFCNTLITESIDE